MLKKNTQAKPKALWLTSSYPRFKDDSASIFLRNLAVSIDKQKYSLHILVPDHGKIEQLVNDNGIQIHPFTYCYPRSLQKLAYGSGILPNLKDHPWLLLQVPLFLIAMLISAWCLIIKLKPAVIHAHWVFPQGTIASLLGKLFNIPVIITAHGGDAFALQGSILSKLKAWGIQNSTVWTSNTSATAQALGTDLPKPNIIPMGIDFKKFSSGNAHMLRSNISPDTYILLFVGRLVKKKGVSDLITAYSLFSESHQKVTQLWIIGDGSERRTLEKLSESLHLENKITFWGKIPNAQLPDFYAAADVFIAPSITDSFGDTEGQGVILLEAMASHTPVIATTAGGIPEVIVDKENGLLVPVNSPAKLAESIRVLINDKQLRMNLIKKAFLRVKKQYDWNIISDQFVNLYLKLAKA